MRISPRQNTGHRQSLVINVFPEAFWIEWLAIFVKEKEKKKPAQMLVTGAKAGFTQGAHGHRTLWRGLCRGRETGLSCTFKKDKRGLMIKDGGLSVYGEKWRFLAKLTSWGELLRWLKKWESLNWVLYEMGFFHKGREGTSAPGSSEPGGLWLYQLGTKMGLSHPHLEN